MEAELCEQSLTVASIQNKFVYMKERKIPLVKVKKKQIIKSPNLREESIYDKDGFLPIHRSVMENDEEKLSRCIQDLLNKEYSIDILTEFQGMTSLQLALKYECSFTIVKLLLNNNPNLLHQDLSFKNAFHYAVDSTVDSYLQILIHHLNKYFSNDEYLNKTKNTVTTKKQNQFIKREFLTFAFTAVNEEGHTPIMECVSKKKIYHLYCILRSLPKAVCEKIINFKNPRDGKTCLFSLEEFNSDPEFTDYFSLQSKIYTKLLLDFGSDPKIKNYRGYSPEMAAKRLKKIKFYRFLEKHRRKK